ncbi:hypothetical protein I7I51_00531 [Histoplasma capsulatum]|uniref:Mitochondrial genome maintenance protein Mgr2 n=1 Tax=Ajellomyces capsulatus TaxID=5037 RepID=A0A8A1MFM6_AJECA|nr:hypothetical protein I7I51_00531 [Histoplasma capsulatum]
MGLGGNSIHNSSKQRGRWGQEIDNSMVTKEARKKLSQHRVQGSWNAMLAIKMGAMMGGSVGLIMGFIMGTVAIFQYGAGPNGVMRTLGKYMIDFLCRLEALSEQKDTPTPTKCGLELEELP